MLVKLIHAKMGRIVTVDVVSGIVKMRDMFALSSQPPAVSRVADPEEYIDNLKALKWRVQG